MGGVRKLGSTGLSEDVILRLSGTSTKNSTNPHFPQTLGCKGTFFSTPWSRRTTMISSRSLLVLRPMSPLTMLSSPHLPQEFDCSGMVPPQDVERMHHRAETRLPRPQGHSQHRRARIITYWRPHGAAFILRPERAPGYRVPFRRAHGFFQFSVEKASWFPVDSRG